MRMALYEFIVKYKPCKENLLADFLSRLNEETPEQDADEENYYHDQLVASIEFTDTQKTGTRHCKRSPNHYRTMARNRIRQDRRPINHKRNIKHEFYKPGTNFRDTRRIYKLLRRTRQRRRHYLDKKFNS